MKYQDPMSQQTFEFTLLPVNSLLLSPYQRELSTNLVNKLVNSVSKGFTHPLVVVQVGDSYEIIDGQHRLAGLQKVMQTSEVPCIIVPLQYKYSPLFYNIEKSDNIKDKCTKVYNVYLDCPNSTEWDILPATNYEPYIFTLAFAYKEFSLSSPSLVESPIKKVDNAAIIDKIDGEVYRPTTTECLERRRQWASLAAKLEETINDMASEYDIRDYNLKRSMITQSSTKLWGRARKIEDPPEEAIPQLIQVIMENDWSWMAGR